VVTENQLPRVDNEGSEPGVELVEDAVDIQESVHIPEVIGILWQLRRIGHFVHLLQSNIRLNDVEPDASSQRQHAPMEQSGGKP
jgi:hypothetical protein